MIDCIVNVVHATRRCRVIVKDLLKFASQQPTEKRPYSLNYVVKRAIGIVKKVHPDWPACLELQLTDQSPHVNLNLLEIEVVIANLVQNAMEAARENPQGKVSVSTKSTDDIAILNVSDNGCGIPRQMLEHIFDPFFTTRRAAGGTGLGLSIVYAIIRDHHGEIHVKSIENVGTTFTIQFPHLSGEHEGDEPEDDKAVGVVDCFPDSFLAVESCGKDRE
jgi:two-component system NtrC family sensor kinase